MSSRSHSLIISFFWFAVSGSFSYGQAQKTDDSACESCHEQGKKVHASVHGKVGCATCHLKHDAYPHPAGIAKPACAQCHAAIAGEHAGSVHGEALKHGNEGAPSCTTCHASAHETAPATSAEFRRAVPQTCGMCHTEISQQFLSSVHGMALAKGITQAPVCTDCHGEHGIQKHTSEASLVHPNHIRETCARCHGDVRLSRRFGLPSDRIVSFDASFHGLATKAGSQTVANCASCHGVHHILAASDPKSTTNAKNLPATCGHCHPGAGKRFALGPVHQASSSRAEPQSVRWVRQIYLVLIPLVIGLMVLHNLGDWLRKLWRLRLVGHTHGLPIPADHGSDQHPRYLRMHRFERIEHGLLLVSFIVLAWTGFQLKYPDQWWSRPFLQWESYWPWRGTVHRAASVVFMLAAVLHVVSLIANRELRRHWRNLWPQRSDVPEAIQNFAYNVGLIAGPPYVSPYSYIEKAEYWAVVWGAVLMGTTGLMLWANNLTLAWLPKEWLDVATALHFYEAVLACLAIVVWHFYMVIFDPDVYPIDTVWLTGTSVRKHGSEAPKC